MILRPSDKYLQFFQKSKKEKIIFFCGGRRSGKTFAIFYRFLFNAEHCSGKSILTTSDTHPNLGKVMSDFSTITEQEPEYRMKIGENISKYRTSDFRFRAYNRPQDAKGTECDELFISEGDGLDKRIFETLSLGVRGKIIIDYNPTQKFWGMDLQTPENTLITTYRDNSFLTRGQIERFEEIERKGKDATVGSAEFVRYQNEILGQFAELGGQVFHHLYFITAEEFDEQQLITYCGVDWGDSIDPTAAANVKFDFVNKKIYIKEIFYLSFVSDSLLLETLKRQRVEWIVYDYATGGNTRFLNFAADADFKTPTYPAHKMDVYSSVKELSEWKICVCGANAQDEFSNYKAQDGKFVGADHLIDAVRYVFIYVAILKNI